MASSEEKIPYGPRLSRPVSTTISSAVVAPGQKSTDGVPWKTAFAAGSRLNLVPDAVPHVVLTVAAAGAKPCRAGASAGSIPYSRDAGGVGWRSGFCGHWLATSG